MQTATVDHLITALRERASAPEWRTDTQDLIATDVFPPAEPSALDEAERLTGLKLPPLLRRIYTEVGNGGFGPGYGLIGVSGGANDDGRTIAELFTEFRRPDEEDPHWAWPEDLLPVCHWGCAIYSCIDCGDERDLVVIFDPNPHDEGPWDDAFRPHTPFREWLQAWVDGRRLWDEMFPAE